MAKITQLVSQFEDIIHEQERSTDLMESSFNDMIKERRSDNLRMQELLRVIRLEQKSISEQTTGESSKFDAQVPVQRRLVTPLLDTRKKITDVVAIINWQGSMRIYRNQSKSVVFNGRASLDKGKIDPFEMTFSGSVSFKNTQTSKGYLSMDMLPRIDLPEIQNRGNGSPISAGFNARTLISKDNIVLIEDMVLEFKTDVKCDDFQYDVRGRFTYKNGNISVNICFHRDNSY